MKNLSNHSVAEQVRLEAEKFAQTLTSAICAKMGLKEECIEFVDYDEPDKVTCTGKKLFPDAHEGNMRRLIRRVLSAHEWDDIRYATRLWMMAAVLIELGLMEDNERCKPDLAVYCELVLDINIAYNHRKVGDYWRHNYPRTSNRRHIGYPPSNADHVLDFARWVKQCATDGEHTDDRLWARPPHRA